MLERFKVFGGGKQETLPKKENLAETAALESVKDFGLAEQIAGETGSKKKSLLAEIAAIQRGKKTPELIKGVVAYPDPSEYKGTYHPEGTYTLGFKKVKVSEDSDAKYYFFHRKMPDVIAPQDLAEARNLAAQAMKDSAFWGAKAYLIIAESESRNKLDPKQSIAKAVEAALKISPRKSQDGPVEWYNIPSAVSVFRDIVSFQISTGLFEDAFKTAKVFKESVVKLDDSSDVAEYNAQTYAIASRLEKELAQAAKEKTKVNK